MHRETHLHFGFQGEARHGGIAWKMSDERARRALSESFPSPASCSPDTIGPLKLVLLTSLLTVSAYAINSEKQRIPTVLMKYRIQTQMERVAVSYISSCPPSSGTLSRVRGFNRCLICLGRLSIMILSKRLDCLRQSRQQ